MRPRRKRTSRVKPPAGPGPGRRQLTDAQLMDALALVLKLLVRRVDALEASVLKSAGLYTSGKAYTVNEIVTYDGSLWQCTEAFVSGAAFDHAHWRLIVKHGRDGRDLRAKHDDR